MEESAPEMLGNCRVLSSENKGTEVDGWKDYESLSWKCSLQQSDCFVTPSPKTLLFKI